MANNVTEIRRTELHPQCQALLAFLDENGKPLGGDQSPDEVRAGFRALIEGAGGARRQLPRVWEMQIQGPGGALPVRLYQPWEGTAPLPAGALLYLHGGGWTIGDLDTHDDLCRDLAALSGCLVASVDYRLAPEHPFPAGLEDCHAALDWLRGEAAGLGVATDHIAVGGDSAGGNLTAVLTQQLRDQGRPQVALQLLIYPSCNLVSRESESARRYGEGFFLTNDAMVWFRDHYLVGSGVDVADPRISPLQASDFSGLPPAVVVTGGCDPLRDEGEAYAERLRAAGVPVVCKRYPGMIHAFVSLAGAIEAGEDARGWLAGELRRGLGRA